MLLAPPSITLSPYTWIDQGTLSRDRRAYCSDIVAQNVQTDVMSFSQNDIGSQSSSQQLYCSTSKHYKSIGG